jgi:translation initiation factor IF-3
VAAPNKQSGQPAVVKIVDYAREAYAAAKAASAAKNSDAAKARQAAATQKMVKFKGAIEGGDLRRNVDKIAAFLREGHPCVAQTTTSRFMQRRNEKAVLASDLCVVVADALKEALGEEDAARLVVKHGAPHQVRAEVRFALPA